MVIRGTDLGHLARRGAGWKVGSSTGMCGIDPVVGIATMGIGNAVVFREAKAEDGVSVATATAHCFLDREVRWLTVDQREFGVWELVPAGATEG